MSTASQLLERARHRAGLSQSEWARRTGVTQPMINRYLRGQAQPSVGQLERLLAGAGFEAELELHPVGRRSSRELGDELVQVLYLADALPQHGRERPLPTPFLQLIKQQNQTP